MRLVALCDIDADALNTRAEAYGISNRYTDFEEMFDKAGLDVVSVCTHAPWHAPVTIAAAQAGIHVRCEKPLSVDLQSADQMLASSPPPGSIWPSVISNVNGVPEPSSLVR